MNKREIVSQLVAKLSETSSRVGSAARTAQEYSIGAPGRNQTRYDSSKEEYGYLADGLNMRRMALDGAQIELRGTILPLNPEQVEEGTLVRVDEGDGRQSRYLILPYGGGETIETEEGDIDVITPSSPLATAMIGKKAGETFSFTVRDRKRNYKVEEVI